MWEKLFQSIFTTDSYILFAALLTLICLYICKRKVKHIKAYVADWERNPEVTTVKYIHGELSVAYNLFTAAISLFPLLGMFGTVKGLLGLNLAVGNMENIKYNFFGALTSTAWGILFSIIFKIVHALVQNEIEEQIAASEKMEKESLSMHTSATGN